jgi:hypothetical protein
MSESEVDPHDILALLEDGPKHQADLTIWLSRPELSDQANARRVKLALGRLKRAMEIKRVGEQRKWALGTYVARNGRPVVGMLRPSAVLAPRAAAPPRTILAERPGAASRMDGDRLVRLIDGVEYEVFTIDDLQAPLAEHWPSRGGSSLSRDSQLTHDRRRFR